MKPLFTFILLCSTLIGQSQDLDKALITQLNNEIEQHVQGVSPGIAVGIVKEGKIVYEHYLGYANLEHQVKIDKNTRFNIASNAKQFTALCILKLMEQGKLDLEDDIRKYVPNLYPNIQDQISISNLLNHTSGIRDYCDLLALTGKTWWKQFISNRDAMELLEKQRDLNFKPGTEYLYSNSNYIVLAAIVKKITGERFSKFTTTMFQDLNMTNTRFLTNYMAVIPNKARPYGNWNGWRETPVITNVHGDGALFTSLQDQLKWEQIVQMNTGKYLSKKLIKESQNPLKNSIDNNYGYGLEFDVYGGWNRTFHNGATGGYRANFSRFPSEKISFVVMTNNRNVPIDYLVKNLVKLVIGFESPNVKYPANPKKIAPLKNRQELTGIYKNEEGTVIKITLKEDTLYREIYQRNPVKLVSEKQGLFYYETIQDLKINFENIGKANQKFTLYMATQKPDSFYKISNLDMNHFDKKALHGTFLNDETGTEIIIKYKEGNNYALIKNGRERNAELVSSDYLRMMGIYKINVIRDSQQKIIGLNIERDRIKNVIFKKISI